MGVQPVYLGWDVPLLTTAVTWLLDDFQRIAPVYPGFEEQVDFSDVVIITPGRRFGARLREALMLACDARGQGLIQPQILTPGSFADVACGRQAATLPQLYREVLAGQAAASMVREQSDSLDGLMLRVPDVDASRTWTRLGATLLQLRDELAGGGWDVDPETWSDDARRLIAEGQEASRWSVINRIMQVYDASLAELDFVDPAQEQLAVLSSGLLHLDFNKILLIGVTDPPVLLRRMIEIAAQEHEVYSLIWAPQNALGHEGFDELGAVDTKWWSQHELEIQDSELCVADGAAEVGQSVLDVLANWNGQFGGSEITVGIAERSLLGPVRETLAAAGAPVRYAGGRLLNQTPAMTVLQNVGAYCQARDFSAFATLLRHPDIAHVIGIEPLDLAAADAYHTNHLPLTVPGADGAQWLWDEGEWGGPCGSGKERSARLTDVEVRLAEVLSDFSVDTPLNVAESMECVRAFLRRLYGDRRFDQANPNDRMQLSMLSQINIAIDLFAQAPSQVQEAFGVAPISEHIDNLLNALEQTRIPEPPDSTAIELTDWLELSLDDAPALILVGLNEGCVPRTEAAHPLLPDALRGALGLEHNASRAARDAHALHALVQSRKHNAGAHFIVARRAANGDPLMPSRLLFQTSDVTRAAERVRRLTGVGEGKGEQSIALHPSFAGKVGSGLRRVEPELKPQTEKSMSVTAFRKYLACPYRYWLQYVQRLEQVDDGDQEMNPASFGSLVHAVLQDFGRDARLRDLDTTESIAAAFDDALDRHAKEIYGAHARASVYVQIEQARSRLHTFAKKQAERVQKGWKILHAEYTVRGRDNPIPVTVGKDVFHIHGRIDRIDFNAATETLGIFDYKTGSSPPEKSHRRGQSNAKEWVDLQLPLYRHLVTRLDINWKQIELGYAMLPSDPDKAGFALAKWDAQELLEADAVASRVVKEIQQGIFWPPTEPAPPYTSEFSAICQDAVLNASPIGGVA